MKKSKIAAILLSSILTVSMAGCGGAGAKGDSEDTVKVGILYSATGSMAISEGAVKDAEVLAIDEINKAGGILGKQIEYIEEDGASEPSTFATKAEKLIDQDKVKAVFGCWTSASRKAVKPVSEEYGNLLWYPVQYEGMESSSNIMYTGAAPNQQIVPAIDYLIDQGYKKFFLLGSDYVFPRTANMIINAQCDAKDVEVVGEEYAQMDQTDFGSIISKIEAAKPDVIINTLNGTGNLSFFKQMSEKNYTADDYMTMSFSIAEEEVKTIGADILEGHMVSWNYYMSTDTPENKAFGRCSDYVLRECGIPKENMLNVFIYAPIEKRLTNCKEELNLEDPGEAYTYLTRIDKAREDFYKHYTRHRFFSTKYRHLLIDSSMAADFGKVADIITDSAKIKFGMNRLQERETR